MIMAKLCAFLLSSIASLIVSKITKAQLAGFYDISYDSTGSARMIYIPQQFKQIDVSQQFEIKTPLSDHCWNKHLQKRLPWCKTQSRSRSDVFCKKGALKNFAEFTSTFGRVFFKWSCCLRPETWLKKRLGHRYFPVNFAKSPFFIEHLCWLLLTKC